MKSLHHLRDQGPTILKSFDNSASPFALGNCREQITRSNSPAI
jgi:hypothetical protein